MLEKYRIYLLNGIIILLLCIGVGLVISKGSADDEPRERQPISKVNPEKRQPEENHLEDGTVNDADDIHVVVNKERKLAQNYTPHDLVVPNVRFSFDGIVEKSYLRKEAAVALEKLFTLAEQEGIELYAVSGFRSYERQVSIYNNNVQTKGQEATDSLSAQPGYSEHQTGLAMDVSSRSNNFDLTASFGETEEGKWLAANAHRAGFIIRYLQGKEAITGYAYEPWHIRYVGEIAKEIHEQGTTLEEYLHANR